MVNGPKPGEDSYDTFYKEKHDILASMKRRAVMLSDGLNKIKGISCTSIDGAMYAFPTIHLPSKKHCVTVPYFWCLWVLLASLYL
jgi:alanine transaminase